MRNDGLTRNSLARRTLLRGLLAASASGLSFAQPPASSRLEIGGAVLDVFFESGRFAAGDTTLLAWVKQSALAVTSYFGRFPVPRARIQISFIGGRRVSNGVSFGEGGAHCRINLGQNASAADLHNDWELTHELTHFSFPSVPERHHWIEEGIATYVEPIARASVGGLPVTQVWSEWVRDMPQGLPAAGDQGLDNTHTWGRTYWGGAVFCFLADVEIRKQTRNAKGLRDALRGINQAGGSIEANWSLDRALNVGDKATGTHVLTTQYSELASKPGSIDLARLWAQLGVRRSESGSVSFDDRAPLAAIRNALVQGP